MGDVFAVKEGSFGERKVCRGPEPEAPSFGRCLPLAYKTPLVLEEGTLEGLIKQRLSVRPGTYPFLLLFFLNVSNTLFFR